MKTQSYNLEVTINVSHPIIIPYLIVFLSKLVKIYPQRVTATSTKRTIMKRTEALSMRKRRQMGTEL